MQRARFWRAVVLCAAAGLLAALFWRQLVLLAKLLLGAGVVAFVLDPLCTALCGRMARPRAALLSLLAGAGVLTLAAGLLFPALARQFADLIASLPTVIDGVNALIRQANAFLQERGLGGASLSGVDWDRLSGMLRSLWSGTARLFGSVAGGISNAVMSCILAYYFLSDKPGTLLKMEMLVPCRFRRPLARVCCAVRDELRSYLRSQALVALCVGALSAAAFALSGVQGYLALGVLVGVANCIPYFGPFLGGVPAVLCALPGGLVSAGLTLLSVLLVQQIDNMFITPRITGGATGLAPAAVMLSVLLGGSAFGWAGMLLAIPTVCIFRSAWRVILTERRIPPS